MHLFCTLLPVLKIHAKATAPGRVHVDKKGRKDEIHGGVTLALANNSWNRQLCLEKVELFVKIVLYEHTKKMTNTLIIFIYIYIKFRSKLINIKSIFVYLAFCKSTFSESPLKRTILKRQCHTITVLPHPPFSPKILKILAELFFKGIDRNPKKASSIA